MPPYVPENQCWHQRDTPSKVDSVAKQPSRNVTKTEKKFYIKKKFKLIFEPFGLFEENIFSFYT